MNMNRRNFLFGSAAAMSLAGCSTAKMGVRARKPGEPVNVACIGYGMQMWSALLPQFVGTNEGWGGEDRNTYGLPDLCRVTVVCDCDKVRAQTGAMTIPMEPYEGGGEGQEGGRKG